MLLIASVFTLQRHVKMAALKRTYWLVLETGFLPDVTSLGELQSLYCHFIVTDDSHMKGWV